MSTATTRSESKLWQRYAEIRAESFCAGNEGREATDFYLENRQEMDTGAVVAWAERFNNDEVSAIQHAMNLKLQDEAAFYAEYQNEPIPAIQYGADLLTADQICGKLNNRERYIVPMNCGKITAFIDIQQNLLYYIVVAWENDFTGYIIDYGSWPDQQRPHFTTRGARYTLASLFPHAGLEGSIYNGLEKLTQKLLAREWHRDDGANLRIERCLIDANRGNSTEVVYQFCRQSTHAAVLMPSHGRFVGASSIPFAEYRKQTGDQVGHNWRVPNVQGKRLVRHVLFDTNYWKSFIQARLVVAMGDPGCLSIFGDSPATHRLLAEHLTAEYRVETEGRGRKVDEWKMRPDAVENHWLDGIVGAAVAASMLGSVLPGTSEPPKGKRERVRLSTLKRNSR